MAKMSGSRSLGWHGINSSKRYHLRLESVHFIDQSIDEGSGKLGKKQIRELLAGIEDRTASEFR